MSRSAARLRLLAVLLLGCALYAPSLGNRFALDDRLVAMAVRDDGTPNEMVRELQPLGRYFTSNYWQGFLDRDILFRPITVLSYALSYAAVGRHLEGEAGEALPQHVVNLTLHLLAVWLAYRLARTARLPRTPALVCALVFAVHAIHSEVVAGVVGRAELLAFVFGAGATLAFVRARGSLRQRLPRYAVAAVALFVAVAAKESAAAWMPFLAVYALVRRVQAQPGLRLWPALAGVLFEAAAVAVLPLAVFLLLRASMIAGLGTDAEAWTQALLRATPGSPRGNALVQWAYALAASVLPTRLSADWGPLVFTPTDAVTSPAPLLALGMLASLLALGLACWRRQPLVFLAVATWFGHGFLTSNVPFRIGTDYAERLYYTPSLGVALLAAWAVARRPQAWRWPGIALLATWTAWNGWLVLQRNPVWRDNDTLHRYEVEHQPRSARILLQWASQLEQRGEPEAARPYLERVVTLLPEHAAAWNHLGTVHARAGRTDEARRCFERSVAAFDATPDVRVAAAINLALAQTIAGRADAAAAALDHAAQTAPARTAARVPELRQAFASKLPYRWFDAFLARLQDAVPGARAWACERALLAHDAEQPRAAVAFAQQALTAALAPPARAQMRLVLAAGLLATGDRAGAERVVDALLADPAVPAALAQQARALLARRR